MLNKHLEFRHLQQLDDNRVVPWESMLHSLCIILYIIKVKNFHEMAVSFLAERWDQLEWEKFSTKPIECE